MAGKENFTVDEWDLLRQSPYRASMVVVAASPSGPIGLIQESAAAAKMMLQAGESAKTPLMQSLVQDLRQKLSLPVLPAAGESTDPLTEDALAKLKQTSDLLATKATPEEADEVKQWLVSIGRATAEAAREGGFLGFGGELVSDEEQAALCEINAALGLRACPSGSTKESTKLVKDQFN